jgi:alpha-beta hydrolase superfamily lysophospholipase
LSRLLVCTGLFWGCHGDAPRAADADSGTARPPQERAWYQFGFQSSVLDSVALFYLGHAWDQSADVGEVLETVGRIDESDPSSWLREWRKTAERLSAHGQQSEQAGHALSASQAYLRAATYFRAALHHAQDPTSPEIRSLAQREVDHFQKYLTLSRSPCEAVRIPYETTSLPGYFCKSPVAAGPAPVLLFQEGRDGWAEDGRFISDEAMKRGFHVLMFDGPGMGQVIRLQGLPFRPDWDRVVTPVVDYAISRSDVDPSRIGLLAVSMGGFLGPQAATKEHRLKVLVANPGVLDWSAIYEGFLSQIDPELLPLLDTDEAAFNARIGQYMQADELLRWGLADSMWHHGVNTPAALMKEVRRYKLEASIADIATHTLVIDAEAEKWGQSRPFYEALTSPKDFLLFTTAETAQFHVQPGATGISAARLLDWLEKAL